MPIIKSIRRELPSWLCFAGLGELTGAPIQRSRNCAGDTAAIRRTARRVSVTSPSGFDQSVVAVVAVVG
jgi:hypothetical protein